MPKAVVSNTVERTEWQNSTVLSGDVVAEIAALKRQDGGNILINGSTTLVRSLLRASLIAHRSSLIDEH